MRSAKRTILIAMLFCVVMSPVCSARAARRTAKENRAKALELLDKYAKTQNKFQSYVIKNETSTEHHSPRSGKRHIYKFSEIRFDGHISYWREERWGNLSEGKFIPKNQAKYRSFLWDGELYLAYLRPPGKQDYVKINRDESALLGKQIITMGNSHSLRGYFYGDVERIDSILRRAGSILTRKETEEINGVECYVIDAITKHGKYTLWIDPKHGYNIAKAIVHKGENDISFHGKHILSKKEIVYTSISGVRFEKINEIWVPMEVDIVTKYTYPDGNFSHSKIHHKIIEITLNPDHDTLRSFCPDDVRNGATVYITDIKGIKYTWQDGKVVDEKGNKVDLHKVRAESEKSRVKRPK